MPVPTTVAVVPAIVHRVVVAVRLEVATKSADVTVVNGAMPVRVERSKVSAAVTFWNESTHQRGVPPPPPLAWTTGPVRAAIYVSLACAVCQAFRHFTEQKRWVER